MRFFRAETAFASSRDINPPAGPVYRPRSLNAPFGRSYGEAGRMLVWVHYEGRFALLAFTALAMLSSLATGAAKPRPTYYKAKRPLR